jgi:hypothetical protein
MDGISGDVILNTGVPITSPNGWAGFQKASRLKYREILALALQKFKKKVLPRPAVGDGIFWQLTLASRRKRVSPFDP